MRIFLLLITHSVILALFFYVKASPWKDKLDPKHRGWFDTLDGIFGKVTKLLGGSSKPYEMGAVQWNMGEILLLAILLGISLLIGSFGKF